MHIVYGSKNVEKQTGTNNQFFYNFRLQDVKVFRCTCTLQDPIEEWNF